MIIGDGPREGNAGMGPIIQFDDPLAPGFRTSLPDGPNPLADQRMVRVDNCDMHKAFARLGGILLRIIPCVMSIPVDMVLKRIWKSL
jgi:hypothetical protein